MTSLSCTCQKRWQRPRLLTVNSTYTRKLALSCVKRHTERMEADIKGAQQARREHEHHLARIRHLTAEVDDLTAANAAADSRRLQTARDADSRVAAVRTAQLEAQQSLDGKVQRIAMLERELQQLESSHARLAESAQRSEAAVQQQAARLDTERSAHREEVAALEAALHEADSTAQQQLAGARTEWDRERKQMEVSLASAQSDAEKMRGEVCMQLWTVFTS